MKKLIQINREYLLNKEVYGKNIKTIEKIVNIINKDKLIIISGLKNIGKLNIIKELLIKTNSEDKFFYFNKNIDFKNKILNNKKLEKLFNEHLELYKNTKIVILENFSKIEGIKNFIPKIFEKNYKIILIGNNIKISGIKEIEILGLSNFEKLSNYILTDKLSYGNFYETKELESIQLKQKYINLIKNDIYLNDIIGNFGVKNIYLYNLVITYIANINIFTSLREQAREINKIEKISLKTLIDYIDFSIKSKLLKQVYQFDLKTNKIISTKSKYYFTDTGLRNSYKNFNLNKDILFENFIFLELLKKGYNILSGKNGAFEFDFICEKILAKSFEKTSHQQLSEKTSPQPSPQGEGVEHSVKIYVHISKQTSKDEIKKEIRKLNKIGNNNKKFLIIPEIEKYSFKKFIYDDVKLIDKKNSVF